MGLHVPPLRRAAQLRAIYAALPNRPFELDARPKGAKAAWRTALVTRVKDLAARERRTRVRGTRSVLRIRRALFRFASHRSGSTSHRTTALRAAAARDPRGLGRRDRRAQVQRDARAHAGVRATRRRVLLPSRDGGRRARAQVRAVDQ
jgi:hypothetical protein